MEKDTKDTLLELIQRFLDAGGVGATLVFLFLLLCILLVITLPDKIIEKLFEQVFIPWLAYQDTGFYVLLILCLILLSMLIFSSKYYKNEIDRLTPYRDLHFKERGIDLKSSKNAHLPEAKKKETNKDEE